MSAKNRLTNLTQDKLTVFSFGFNTSEILVFFSWFFRMGPPRVNERKTSGVLYLMCLNGHLL